MKLNRLFMTHLVLCFCVFAGTLSAQTTEFTYQGRLTVGGAPATTPHDFQFRLFDVPAGGAPLGGLVLTKPGVPVSNGIFTVNDLDFGTHFNTGADRWLDISVRPAGSGSYVPLAQRQRVTSAPYNIRSRLAASADTATTATTANNVTGIVAIANGGTGSSTQNFVDLTTNQTIGGTKTFTSPIVGNGSQLTNINGANITNNTINASALASDTFPNQRNLQLLGSLRWDLLGQRVVVGSAPYGVAFDGANIWVANNGSSNVTKLRASDGANLGTFPVGSGSVGVAFDGANIWVVNNGSNNVVKLPVFP